MNEAAASNFINSLVRNLQVLCHSNVEFRDDIEVVGHLYLKVDKARKFNYIVDEKVCKNDASSTMFVSNSYHSVNPVPKKTAGQSAKSSDKPASESGDSTASGIDLARHNLKGESRPILSPHRSGVPDVYKTPIKRGMRSPDHPSRKVPRMSMDSTGGTAHQAFSFSLQRDRESPHKSDRSVSQDSSSSHSFKDDTNHSETVEIDLTNIKEEVDDKSVIQASCFFNQEHHDMLEQQNMLGHSGVPSFPNPSKDSTSDEMLGLYPVSLHHNENPNLDSLAHLSSSIAGSSAHSSQFGQSPQQMPQFLSELFPEQRKTLSLQEKVEMLKMVDSETYSGSKGQAVKTVCKKFGIGRATVYNYLKSRDSIMEQYYHEMQDVSTPTEQHSC